MPPWKLSSDAVKMILPARRSTIPRPSSRASTNGAVRFTSSMRSHVAVSKSTAGALAIEPALLTRMSIGGSLAASVPARSSTADRSPLASSCALTPTMSAPARASAWAIARPMPRRAPVTTARFPVRSNSAPGWSAPPPAGIHLLPAQSSRIFMALPDSSSANASETSASGVTRVIIACAAMPPPARSLTASVKSWRS